MNWPIWPWRRSDTPPRFETRRYELDIFWPEAGVAIEIDGWQHHSSRPRFEGDRRKDNWLRSHGIEVIRLTWRQITRDATATAVQVGQILALAEAQQPGAKTVPVSPVLRGQSRRLRQSAAR